MAAFGDEDELERAHSAFPELDDDFGGFGDAPVAPAPIPSIASEPLDFSFDPLPANNAPAVKVTGDDEIEKFESQFPDLGDDTYSAPQQQQQPSFGSFSPQPPAQQPTYRVPSVQPAFEEEPDVIKQWKEQQAAEIKKRDEMAERRREEIKNQANQSIDDFYLEHKEKVERNIKENKLAEEEFGEKLTESLSAGTTWSRICETIELENSQSKTLARTGPGTTDLTRYKEILLRLKREGTTAPGAGGY